MKKVFGFLAIMVILGAYVTQLYASSGCAVATLTTNNKTASSSFVGFDADYMYCRVDKISKYPIKFEEFGNNDPARPKAVLEKTIIYNVNASGTVRINSSLNYHKIALTGWNVNSKVKNCLGTGKVY